MKFRAVLSDRYDLEERKKFAIKDWHKTVLFFVIIAAVLNLLAVFYVNGGRTIFFWDDANYWNISRRIASGAVNEGGFWSNVYKSVAAEDYNYIAALPSALVMKLFGESRLAYILGLTNIYLLPSYIMIYLLAKKVSKAPKIAFALTVLLFPCMALLTFIGFVDVGALLICLIAYYAYYPKNDAKDNPLRYVFIGALLVLAVLWRRYFAFFAVSFVVAMVADSAIFKRKWYAPVITVLTICAILGLCFTDFVFHKLMADYGNMYASYKFPVMDNFKLMTRHLGLLLIIVLAVSSVAARVKKKETRTVFMWLQIIVCLAMFISTQMHGQQHLLLYIPSLIMITLIIIRHITKEWMLVGLGALALLHSVFVYIPRPQPHSLQEVKGLAIIPTFSLVPERRTDTDEILSLKQKLNQTVPDGDKLGVLASSYRLNEDTFKNVEASLGIPETRTNYIVPLPQVDSRDKDLSALYTVNYVLAAYPAQTHLTPGSQTIVEEAVRSFEVYADIATAYEEVPECETVIDGVTMKLYRRVRNEEPSDIAEFESRLYGAN